MAKRVSAEFQEHHKQMKSTRWSMLVPKIKREYMQHGVRYYETNDGRKWQADIFDLKLIAPKLKINMNAKDRSIHDTLKIV
jgi:hypothetical protein